MFRQDYKDFLFFVFCSIVGGTIILNTDKLLALRPAKGHKPVRKRSRAGKLNHSNPATTNRSKLYKR